MNLQSWLIYLRQMQRIKFLLPLDSVVGEAIILTLINNEEVIYERIIQN